MKKPADLSVIIVNYNSAAFLKECLISLGKQQGITLQVIVVDNCSTDDSVELVRADFPWIELVCRNTSLGFSAGNNAGVALAAADHILFLNPDTKFTNPLTLKKCLEKYQTTQGIGVLTCRIDLVLTGGIDQTCHRGFPTPWASLTHFSGLSRAFPQTKLFGQYYMTHLGYTTEHQIDAAGGMFMLVSRKIGDKIGWWDEEYSLYGEDIDFCYRVKQAGFSVLYWPSETVLHYKGAATGMSKQSKTVTTASIATTKQVKSLSIEAMEIFYRKHFQSKYPFFINWAVSLGIRLLKFIRVNLA
jgi:GT2 family glycosyltransferase